MPVNRDDPFARNFFMREMRDSGFEQAPDARIRAIEKYMQEQGNDSRTPTLDFPGGIDHYGIHESEAEWGQPADQLNPHESPNEYEHGASRWREQEQMMRQFEDYIREQAQPYRGPMKLYRGR